MEWNYPEILERQCGKFKFQTTNEMASEISIEQTVDFTSFRRIPVTVITTLEVNRSGRN